MAVKVEDRTGLDEVMTVAQVADYLHLNKLTVYKYIRDGKLPAARLRRTFRVMREDVHKFLEAQRVGPEMKAKPVRQVPRVSPPAPAQPARATHQDFEGYFDPRREGVQSRESMVAYNPVHWVIKDLH